MTPLQRWPLLFPVCAAMFGLMLTRTDVLGVAVACILLVVVTFIFCWLQRYWLVLMLLLGACWGAADLLLDARDAVVDASWLQGDMMVSAEVDKVEQRPSYRRYLLSNIQNDQGVLLPGDALLYHYRYGAKHKHVSIVAGQRIRVRVRWHVPRNFHNPAAFDYRAWCFDRHISLIGSLRGKLELLDPAVPWLERQRQKVRDALSHSEYGRDGVLPALLLAERGMISQQAKRVFSATGTAHLLAISGMHVGMVAAWVFALIWFVLTRREAWIVALPVRNLALLGGFLAAAAYATLAGWPLPAVRAAMMLGAGVLAWCLSSRSEPINTLLAALLLILLWDASAIASLSLWLSFVATASLLLWARVVRQTKNVVWWHRLIAAAGMLLWISLLASLATLPFIITTFGRIPVYSLPANMIMVPLYSLWVMPAALLGELCALVGLDVWATGLMSLSNMAVGMGLNVLKALAALPAGELWAVQPSLWMGGLYGAGMLLSGCLLWAKKKALAACLAMLVLIFYVSSVLQERDVLQAQWLVWDVGQGAASTLLLPGNQVIVVDVPGHRGSRFNGGTTVAAGLRALGLSHVDVLVLSHAQSDHLGGALSLLRGVNHVGEVWLPDVPDAHADKRVKAIEDYAESHAISVRWMAQGDVWKYQSTLLTVLWPPRLHDPANSNNTSLVLRATLAAEAGKGVSMLWPGDIEAVAERGLLQAQANLQPVDVMLMPHHGSRSSSHAGFVQRLRPAIVIAQTGVANRYGFPSAIVVQRYQAQQAHIYNTVHGAIVVTWNGEKPVVHVGQWSGKDDARRDLARLWWGALSS